jgi:raffinose/stachyose/melibiose transport system substrate-binding protein
MKFSGRLIAFTLLGLAYAAATFLVLRHTTEEVRSDRVIIRLSQWQLEGGVREAIDAIIRRYEQLNPRVHVVHLAVPDPVYQPWIQTQMVGGTGPDLAEYSWPWPDTARNFQPISAEVMQPNPYNRGTPLEGVPWRDTFIDGMTSPDNYVQTLSDYYGVSLTTHVMRIVFNRPLLKTVTGRETPPRTYRELVALCAGVRAYATAHGLKLVPLANSRTTHTNLTYETLSAMTTGLSERIDFQHRLKLEAPELGVAYLRGEWSYDSPEMIAALESLKEIGAMSTPGFMQRERDSALTDFVSGRAVMIVTPSWEASSLLQLCPFAIGAFRFPHPHEDDPVFGRHARSPMSEGQLLTGMPFYVNRHTKHRAEAIDFLRFMSSQEGATIFTQVSNWQPVTVGVKASDFADQFKLQPEGYCWYASFFDPSGHFDAQKFIASQLGTLWNNEGSVDAFRKVMREGIGAKVREDFRRDVIAAVSNSRREDIVATARAELAPSAAPPDTLRLTTVGNEIKVYQTRAVLALPEEAAR